jgi:hypothetical protein
MDRARATGVRVVVGEQEQQHVAPTRASAIVAGSAL